ncbi:Agamous-like MADS-box protein AGL62 [Abeliophyllum distichum]|uniref:Agamous-like MADS-box protein AGL62 n=1 Tax=Abeliophyllum distichum TaxID=126358 RepID=A0ABD1P9G5_9LAMI
MKKIENKECRHGTFSKQRDSIFREASKLSTLTGAQVGIIMFSPDDDKAYAFGHPDINTITDRFVVAKKIQPPIETEKLIQAHGNATMEKENLELGKKEELKETEIKRGEELREKMKDGGKWFGSTSIDELNFEQLDQLKESYVRFKQNLETEMERRSSMNP